MLQPRSNRVRTTAASESLGCTATSGRGGCTPSAPSSSRSDLQGGRGAPGRSGSPAALLASSTGPPAASTGREHQRCQHAHAAGASQASREVARVAAGTSDSAALASALPQYPPSQHTHTLTHMYATPPHPPIHTPTSPPTPPHRIVCRSISCSLIGFTPLLTTDRRRCRRRRGAQAGAADGRECRAQAAGKQALPRAAGHSACWVPDVHVSPCHQPCVGASC